MRISFVGGFTDIPSFYKMHGGAVINTAIDKYVTVKCEPLAENQISVNAISNGVDVSDVLRHKSVHIIREALDLMRIHEGVSVTIESDVKPGSGLGGSSAFAVGLIKALQRFSCRHVGRQNFWQSIPESYAQLACELEIERLGSPIGKQDQYITAYGGLRRFDFRDDNSVVTKILRTPPELEESMMLFDTGITRRSNEIMKDFPKTVDATIMLQMKGQVGEMERLLEVGDMQGIGALLEDAWMLKTTLSPLITNVQLDKIYDVALEAGAYGGKLLGAGGGGHFLFIAPEQYRDDVKEALSPYCTHVPFKFDRKGSQLIDKKCS